MPRYQNDPRWIKARFESECSETGNTIKKGDTCLYFPRERKAVHPSSPSAESWKSQEFADTAGLADAGW